VDHGGDVALASALTGQKLKDRALLETRGVLWMHAGLGAGARRGGGRCARMGKLRVEGV